jgi:TusA-related sulfurtransferase
MMTAMKIRHEVTYDAGVDEVYAMLADPEFRKKSCDAMGVVSADVKIDAAGDKLRVIIDQVQRTEGIPSFAKKFAGETTRAVQTEEWDDHAGATLVVTTPGKPTTITGRISLVASGGSTVQAFEGEAKVKVPLIGGKLEALAADLFRDGREKERAVGVAWLAGDR